jgi:hypothetical protein
VWQLATQAVYHTNQRQAHTKAEERDPFLTTTIPTKHSLPELRKWPRPLSPSRRKSKKSEDQAEHRRTLPEAAKIYTYATRANKTVSTGLIPPLPPDL